MEMESSVKSSVSGTIYFTPIDYIVLFVLLALSSLIGIYYGFVAKRKQDNTTEYLLGTKQITLFPISISLIASHISGTTLLGLPMEIYAYGTQFWVSTVTAIAIPFSIIHIFYPIFYDLKLLSTFMYFERRFNRAVRLFGSAVSLWGIIVFLPVVIYIPALAFNQVSGVNVHVITPVICVICILYTTIGGLRAVVWTDTLQFFLMLGAVVLVIGLGILNLNSPLDIWHAAERSERLIFFNFDPNPLARSTFWTVSLGLTTTWVCAYGSAQSCIQKLLSVPDQKTAYRAIWIYSAGLILFNIIGITIGLVMIANLENCDPFTAGIVAKLDQVLPYFVMKVGSRIPGLPGIFIAGIFSAALSTMSSLLNTMSCMIYDDFLRKRLEHYGENTISSILKIIVVALGVLVMGLVLVIEKLGTVFQIAISLSGVSAGTVLGLFSAGMLSRRFNTKGALWGGIASAILVGCITVGATSRPKPVTLPMSTSSCDSLSDVQRNVTVANALSAAAKYTEMDEGIFWLFRISFMYYALIGCAIVWIVGMPISWLSKPDKPVDENLLAPFIRKKTSTYEIQQLSNIESKASPNSI